MGTIKADNKTLDRIMTELKNGKYNIPRFQREFVWSSSKITKLLESIENNYPIGIFTMAIMSNNVLSGRNGIIDSIIDRYETTATIVVDGQQRMTSMAIVWFANELKEKVISKQLTIQISKTISSVVDKVVLYKDKFYNIDILVERLMEESANISINKAKAEASKYIISNKEINIMVREKIGKTQIFTHTLLNWDLKGIISIFQAMNSKVKALTHIDLMNGSMFSLTNEEFDLIAFMSSSNKKWASKGVIKQELFVQLMKIYSDLHLNEPVSVKYKADALVEWSNNDELVKGFIENKLDFVAMIKKALQYLDKKLNIAIIKNLPKEVYFLVVFAMCAIDIEKSKFENIFKKTIAYISKRLIFGDYASSPNAKAMDDINGYLLDLAADKSVSKYEEKYEDWETYFDMASAELSYKRKNQAFFKIAIAALVSNHPKNLFNFEDVPVNPNEVKEHKVDIHHFIPKNSAFEKEYRFGEELNGIGNLMLLTEDENRNEIRNKNIKEYLTDAALRNKKLKESLESHFFDYEEIMKLKDVEDKKELVVHQDVEQIFQDRKESIINVMKEKFFDYE